MTDEDKKERKLDLFEVLKKIDSGDRTFLDNLEDEVKKEFVPLITMRWASSAGGMQAVLLNELVNPMVFKMHDHPGLLYKLMVVSSEGKSRRYKWLKSKSKVRTNKLTVKTIAAYYRCTSRDADFYAKRLPLEEILEMAEALGYDADTVKEIKAEHK